MAAFDISIPWESEAADFGLLGDTRGGERSVRTGRDTGKMNESTREVLLGENARGHKRYHKMCISHNQRKACSWRCSLIFCRQRHEHTLR